MKNKYDIKTLEEIALKNNGKLISKEWNGVSAKYTFQLESKEIFSSHFYTILKRWPKKEDSRFKSKEMYLKEMSEIAISRGGKLLSTEWKNYSHKYDFIDANNIKFSLSIESLRKGSWIPNRGLVSEPICNQILEHLFGYKFIKTRKILTKELCGTKVPLELDGYCSELKIAFEYQGYPSHWDIHHKNYVQTHKRDNLKKLICENLGIKLITIPKLEIDSHLWNEDKILKFILNIINKSYIGTETNIPILNTENFKIDYSKIAHPLNMLRKLKEIAEKNKGKLISIEWKGIKSKYLFQTNDGKEFQMNADKIISRGWPKNEIKYLKTNLDRYNDLKILANNNNAKLLSTEWKGRDYLYEFQLSSGETFKRTFKKIQNNWPKNENEYLKSYKSQTKEKYNFLLELQIIAENNNGKLLSTEWINNKEKYKFQSENGNIFEMRAEEMRKRGWPKNFKNYIRTDEEHLNELNVIAKKSNICLLEKKWLGIKAKYLCEFPDGRQFSISADIIKRRGFPKNADKYFKRINNII